MKRRKCGLPSSLLNKPHVRAINTTFTSKRFLAHLFSITSFYYSSSEFFVYFINRGHYSNAIEYKCNQPLTFVSEYDRLITNVINERICMNQNNSKPWYKRFWVWLGLIVLLGVVVSVASPKETPKLAEGSSSGSGSSEQKTEQTSFKVGDVIAFDEKKVTVVSVQRSWDTGNQFMKPDAGNEFVKVQVSIENNSKSEAMYNTFDWKLQDSKGVIKDVDATGYGVEGALSSGELAGFLVFEVASGDAGLTLRYNASFWSDRKIEVKL